ncbi:hypothetical protein VDGL01_11894 [Verticillium dahliae]
MTCPPTNGERSQALSEKTNFRKSVIVFEARQRPRHDPTTPLTPTNFNCTMGSNANPTRSVQSASR